MFCLKTNWVSLAFLFGMSSTISKERSCLVFFHFVISVRRSLHYDAPQKKLHPSTFFHFHFNMPTSMQLKAAHTIHAVRITHATIIIRRSLPTSPDVFVSSLHKELFLLPCTLHKSLAAAPIFAITTSTLEHYYHNYGYSYEVY